MNGIPPIRRVVISMDTFGTLGGVQTVVQTLTSGFRARGFTVQHMSFNPPIETVESQSVFEVNPYRALTTENPLSTEYPGPLGIKLGIQKLGTPLWRQWRNQRLRKFMRGLGPETALIHTQPWTPNLLNLLGYREWSAAEAQPFIVQQFHSGRIGIESNYPRDVISRIASDADAVVALCPPDAEAFEELLQRDIIWVRNPAPQLEDVGETKRSAAVSLGFVGRLAPEKRVDWLIQAFELIADQHPDTTLHIFGDGPEAGRIASLATASPASIKIHGRQPITSALRMTDLLCLTSSYEGVPTIVLEGALQGIPTVSFRCSPGVEDLVGRAGFLVDGDTIVDYAQALQFILSNPQAYSAESRACELLARSHALESVLDQWQTVFDQVRVRRGRHFGPRLD